MMLLTHFEHVTFPFPTEGPPRVGIVYRAEQNNTFLSHEGAKSTSEHCHSKAAIAHPSINALNDRRKRALVTLSRVAGRFFMVPIIGSINF